MRSVEFWKLERYGDSVAIEAGDDAPISYARLAALADAFAAQLPADRQLVALEARNDVAAVAAYLGCLRHRHPVIILSGESLTDGRIVSEYEPNWLYEKRDDKWCLTRLGNRTDTTFTDELAVLLSTSGTTGAPKLVKLSFDNIASNAAAIAEYLRLTADDCAITTLEFCYSYGMSVVNSHLSIGARILLTDESIVSKRFWSLFTSKGATSLAFVPSHFDLLDRIEFAGMTLPTLRYVTQAGGKLHADKTKKYAEIARKMGWSFYVMYGQTEASPRISYVPPDALLANVDSIGMAIPGGEIVLLDESGAEIADAGRTGELVYRGPNVMLGYAESRADLARPRDTVDLRTGDMAQRQDNGYFKIVGRLSRFIKLYGLRINLDEVEAQLRREGYQVYCTGTDETLALFHSGGPDEAALRALVHDRYNIQTSQIFIKKIADVPLLSSGKVDYRTLSAMIAPPKAAARAKIGVKSVFAEALVNNDFDETDSFTSIGGDSLAYLNISLGLEEALGYLPEDWERMPIRDLERLRPKRSAFMSLPIDIIVRNIAIFLVVLDHIMDPGFPGGAIALILLVGHSLAKYDANRLLSGRLGKFLWSKLWRILGIYYFILCSFLIITWGKHDLAEGVAWLALFRTDEYFDTPLYAYWFIAAYAQLILMIAAVWQFSAIKRLFSDNKSAFGYAAVLFGFVTAYFVERLEPTQLYSLNTFSILHVCMLGWCAYFAKTVRQKAIVSAFVIVAIALFWSRSIIAPTEAKVEFFDFSLLAACLAVTWLDRISVPRLFGSFMMWLASLSFYIYLMHMVPLFLYDRFAVVRAHVGRPEKTILTIVLSVVLAVFAARFMALLEAGVRRVRFAGSRAY